MFTLYLQTFSLQQKLVKNGLIEEIQLEGHLGITKEVIAFVNSEEKYSIGCDPDGRWSQTTKSKGLIRLLIDEYIFPASKAMVLLQRNQGRNIAIEEVNPICSSPATLSAAFEVLVVLCTNCLTNLQLVAQTLNEMFYSDDSDQNLEWEYLPPVGPRPTRGFVGLKNAGATCYMNSVLQQVSFSYVYEVVLTTLFLFQLFMVTEIREGILAVEGAINDPLEEFSTEDRPEPVVTVTPDDDSSREETRNQYNLGVLKYVQAIFGHLALSKLQYYIPRGFWKHFK